MEDDEDDGFSDLRFGEIDEDRIDWSGDLSDDPDDEPSEQTPRSIIAALGYDPLAINDEESDGGDEMEAEDDADPDLPLLEEEDEI
ncbi:MAG: hypothetical protein M0Z37_00195 [Nitrospiraceae bacterium]|jgi:hypothetical protein|nr:hypothetical protein [Nitrospiraceae bacterium]